MDQIFNSNYEMKIRSSGVVGNFDGNGSPSFKKNGEKTEPIRYVFSLGGDNLKDYLCFN